MQHEDVHFVSERQTLYSCVPHGEAPLLDNADGLPPFRGADWIFQANFKKGQHGIIVVIEFLKLFYFIASTR